MALPTISEGIGYGPLATISQGFVSTADAIEQILDVIVELHPLIATNLRLSPVVDVLLSLTPQLQTRLMIESAIAVVALQPEIRGRLMLEELET